MKDCWLGATIHVHHKGGNSQAEMDKANTLSQQQLQLSNQMFQAQQQRFGQLDPQLQRIIANGGLLPQTESAMRSNALNQIGAGENQAIGQINQALQARGISGGGMAGSGDIARNFGALQQGLLGQTATSLNDIQLAKAQGLQGALGMGYGVAQGVGQQALGLGSQGVNALGIGQQAAQAADQAQTGFWGSLFGGLAGMGGQALSGGLSKGGALGCWVAAELYGGWDSDEVYALQNFIFGTWWLKPFGWVYAHLGERWADWIHSDPTARNWTKKLFDWLLRKANAR